MTAKISYLMICVPLLAILLLAFMVVISINGMAEMYYSLRGDG